MRMHGMVLITCRDKGCPLIYIIYYMRVCFFVCVYVWMYGCGSYDAMRQFAIYLCRDSPEVRWSCDIILVYLFVCVCVYCSVDSKAICLINTVRSILCIPRYQCHIQKTTFHWTFFTVLCKFVAKTQPYRYYSHTLWQLDQNFFVK